MTLSDEIAGAMADVAGLSITPLGPLGGGALEVQWREGERLRRVAVREVGDLLVIVAGVCREEDTSPRRVLSAAAHLNGAGAALIKGKIVLRSALPRGRRDPASLREVLTSLNATARRFGKQVVGSTPGEDAVFVPYES